MSHIRSRVSIRSLHFARSGSMRIVAADPAISIAINAPLVGWLRCGEDAGSTTFIISRPQFRPARASTNEAVAMPYDRDPVAVIPVPLCLSGVDAGGVGNGIRLGAPS